MNRREALKSIAAEAAAGELAFPTNAEVALRVQRALDDPDCHIEAAARLVQTEPLLAARVVALANSVAFNRSSHPVDDVRSAVSLLGFQLIRLLATALIMRQMVASAGSEQQRRLAQALWQHSVCIAALTHVLARQLTTQAPDIALFGGMVHAIGGFYLISRASAYPQLLDEKGTAGFTPHETNLVSVAVLRALQVPAPLVAAIAGMDQARLTLPPVTLDEILFLAHHLCPSENPLLVCADDENSAEIRRLVSTDARLVVLLKESQREIDSLIAALDL